MRSRHTSVTVAGLVGFLTIALACTSGPYDNQCESLGGACVTSDDQCGGSLPYSCNVGVCCVPNGQPAPGDAGVPDTFVKTPSVDGGVVTPSPDATMSDATLDGPTPTPDATPAPDGAAPEDAPGEAESPDQSSPGDAGHDAGVDAASADAGHDAGVADTGTDAGGTMSDASGGDAGPGCAAYTAPGTTDVCTACVVENKPCQANGCFGGYYCHDGLTCVKPSKVVCM